MMDKVFVMKKKELAFLLACRGCRHNCGLPLDNAKKEQVPALMEGLWKKGWLLNEGSHFTVCREITEVTGQIAQAAHFWHLLAAGVPDGSCCLYPGDKLLLLRESAVRTDSLYLKYVEREQLLHFLSEEGYLAEETEQAAPFCPDPDAICLPERVRDANELKAWPGLSFWMSAVDAKSGTFSGHLAIWREGLYDYILYEEQEKKEMLPYSLKNLAEKWEETGWF